MQGGLFKKEKGQMSIEVLIIMAVLTIGALIVGTYYISTINVNIKKERSADFDGSRAFGNKTPQTIVCGDTICSAPTENCSNCAFDCGACPPTECTSGQLNSINFSPGGGTYTTPQTVSLSYAGSCPDVNIFYTWDESEPTTSSSHYQEPLIVFNTTTYKAKVFANNNSISGQVITQTYTISPAALCPAGGGDGSVASPKIICTADDLNAIRNHVDWHYVLGQDIDLNVSPYNTGNGWEPIINFSGTLNGNNHSIKNLYIFRVSGNNSYLGLFSRVLVEDANDGIITDLNLIDVNINDHGGVYLGSLAGGIKINNCSNLKYIENVHVTGAINGHNDIGGIIGAINTTPVCDGNFYLKNISFDGNVFANGVDVGGLVAYSSVGLQDSRFNGNVMGLAKVGGLIGKLDTKNGLVSSSYSTGFVEGVYYQGTVYLDSIGGLIGAVTSGKINNCYSLATVSAHRLIHTIGGLIGYLELGSMIENCYYDGNVSGADFVGGLVGENKGEIKFSHSHGFVSGIQVTPEYYTAHALGGLVGLNNNGILKNNYSDVDVNGYSIAGGLVGYGRCDQVIENSYSVGDVSGSDGVGGFIGYIGAAFAEPCGHGIFNCYSQGTVKRKGGTEDTFGGFIGYVADSPEIIITKSYSIGRIIYEPEAADPTDKGFSGADVLGGTNNFWDINASKQLTSPEGATGKTTTEMKTKSTFTGWDFTNVWAIDPSKNNGYPYLRNNPPQ